jgi:small subunit ribosomal protein S6
MKKYEVMAIIANDLSAADAEAQAKKSVLDRVTEMKGKVTFEDFWGEKGFAYKIEGEKWGYYFVAQFEISPEKIAELERELNIDKKIVRFLVTALTKKSGEPVKYADLLKKQVEAKKEAEIAEVEAKTTPTKKEMETEKSADQKPTEKKDAVDKKLDAIMDDASLDL